MLERPRSSARIRLATLVLATAGCPGEDEPDASASAAAATADSGGQPTCEPVPLLGGDEPSGYERCLPIDAVNRVAAVACPPANGELTPGDPEQCGPCDAFPTGGECVRGSPVRNFCHYDCSTDADCGPGAACLCAIEAGAPFNQCVTATCTTNDDCEVGCGYSLYCNEPNALRCRDEAVECLGHGDCPTESQPNNDFCAYKSNPGDWVCLECAGE